MDEERDIELAEDAAATDEHSNGTKKSVAVKWFRHETGHWRRFNCQPWTYAALMAQVHAIEPNFRGQLFYRDIDGDTIVFNTDAEVRTMLQYQREQLKTDTVKLESQELKEGEEKQAPKNNGISDYDYAQKPIHPNIICDVCDGEVRGIRYKCWVCPDFDLCERCERTGVHGDHAMCRLATMKTPKPSLLIPPFHHRHHHHHQMKKPSSPPTDFDVAKDLFKQLKLEAKMDKVERKCAKKVAKREQNLRDRAFRAIHRIDRTNGGGGNDVENIQQKPTAPPTDEANGQQQQQNHSSRVDYLKEIGQHVQRALMSFGIECDAEVQDERGVVHGRVPFPTPNVNSPPKAQQKNSKPMEKTNGAKCPLLNAPICQEADGVLQRPQLSQKQSSSSSKYPKCPSAVMQTECLRQAVREAQERVQARRAKLEQQLKQSSDAAAKAREGAKMKEGELLNNLKQATASATEMLNRMVTPQQNAKPVATPPPSREKSSSSSNLSTPPSGSTSRRAPTLAELENAEHAEMEAALAATQEAAKKASKMALSGLETATQMIGEILAGFDPATGQNANRFGQNIVEAARQGAENLTEKLLSPELLRPLLLSQHQAQPPQNANPTTPTAPQENVVEKKNETAEEVVLNAHLHNNEQPQQVAEQLVAMTDSHLAHRFSELHVDEREKNEEHIAATVEEMPKEQVVADEKILHKPEEEIVEVLGEDGHEQSSNKLVDRKRKLEDEQDLMKLSTHTAIEMEQKDSMGDGQKPTDESFDLDMSSLASRSSSSSVSSSEDDDGSGWMVVKKESFKKLCDFYEKRRRLEKDQHDPFAAQLEREFHEALAAIGEDQPKTNEKVDEESMITGAEGQIVVIDEGKEEAKPEEVVVANLNKVAELVDEPLIIVDGTVCPHQIIMRGVCAKCGQDFRKPDEMIGHSRNFVPQPPTENAAQPKADAEKPKRLYPDLVPEKQKKGEQCTAGLPYPGYIKKTSNETEHSRECEWKHKNLIVQSVADQLVGMGFDNCNGWLFRVVEQVGPHDMDRIFAVIEADPMHRARVSLEYLG